MLLFPIEQAWNEHFDEIVYQDVDVMNQTSSSWDTIPKVSSRSTRFPHMGNTCINLRVLALKSDAPKLNKD